MDLRRDTSGDFKKFNRKSRGRGFRFIFAQEPARTARKTQTLKFCAR